MSENLKIGIIGAGIQGVCSALFLQKKGCKVTLFDKNDPGSMSSYGNAGHFSPYAVVQLNRPDVIYDIPKMLLSSYGPLALKWNYIPKMIPWILKYLKSSSKKSSFLLSFNFKFQLCLLKYSDFLDLIKHL